MNVKMFILLSCFIIVGLISGLLVLSMMDMENRQSIDLTNENYDLNVYMGADPEKAQEVNEDQALASLKDVKEENFTAEDVVSSFFGLLKNQEYYAAASLVHMQRYSEYFLSDPNKVDQLEAQIHDFGERITKKGTLKHVQLATPYRNFGNLVINTKITYENESVVEYDFNLMQEIDLHTGLRHWYIDLDIPDLLQKISSD